MVSFAEFVKENKLAVACNPSDNSPDVYNSKFGYLLDFESLRVWVEEQIKVLNKEIEILESKPNNVQYHDEVVGRMFQIKFCKEMLEGLK